MTDKEIFDKICDLTTKVMGFNSGSLKLKSRKRPLHVARAVAAYIGRSEDIHHTIIGNRLNRDRSLVYHYEKTHKGNYATCPIYRKTFNKVYKVYKDIDKQKGTFLNDDFLKQHLLKNGVSENKKAQVFLEVKSGKAMCIVITSYFDFSNQLKNVKLALKDYHFKINIKSE
tara:strand:- start:907 stop:1419 length:513 start_codon:yes stop_codon:yes gene_type:complete